MRNPLHAGSGVTPKIFSAEKNPACKSHATAWVAQLISTGRQPGILSVIKPILVGLTRKDSTARIIQLVA